jgi:hypothetical protein
MANKVFQFFEGNIKMLGDALGFFANFEKEQILYRTSICSDCVAQGECKYCGCSLPGKFYVRMSCNGGERFPDLMSQQEWEEYKKANGIEIKL